MKKILLGGIIMILWFTTMNLYAGKGKLRVRSEPSGAYIYVDGEKKAMTGEGFTSILLEEGDHSIKVAKSLDDNIEYTQTKKVYIGENTSTKLSFKLKRALITQSKVAEKIKQSRWKRSNNVVIDTKLGLMWQDNRAAKSVTRTWKFAQRYCKNLSMGGYSDWRLPTYDELLSIVDYDRYDPAIMPSFQNVAKEDYYWSSSDYVPESEFAWFVDLNSGYGAHTHSKSSKLSVRCVRGR